MTLLANQSTSLKWHALPPLWLVVLVIVPAVFLAVRFFYRREAGRIGRRARIALGLLRVASILAVLTALFGPFAEMIQGEYYKRHLILAVDTSLSMGIRDTYAANRDIAARIRAAAGYPEGADLASRFEHGRDVTFALDGAHNRLPCASSHPREGAPPGFVRYRPLGQTCADGCQPNCQAGADSGQSSTNRSQSNFHFCLLVN